MGIVVNALRSRDETKYRSVSNHTGTHVAPLWSGATSLIKGACHHHLVWVDILFDNPACADMSRGWKAARSQEF
eukprot:5143371-Amphidinium_carterae.1